MVPPALPVPDDAEENQIGVPNPPAPAADPVEPVVPDMPVPDREFEKFAVQCKDLVKAVFVNQPAGARGEIQKHMQVRREFHRRMVIAERVVKVAKRMSYVARFNADKLNRSMVLEQQFDEGYLHAQLLRLEVKNNTFEAVPLFAFSCSPLPPVYQSDVNSR